MRGKALLGFLVLSCAAKERIPVVLHDPVIRDERIWSLLVGERVGFCVRDTIYYQKLKEVRDTLVYFQAGPFAYMPTRSLALSDIDSVLVWLPLHEGGGCILIPVGCVGGGIMSFIPAYLVLEHINHPTYPNTEATERFNFFVAIGLAAGLTVAGGYYSWQYIRHAGESDYKTELFLRRLEESK
ncbi:MAG: hypothetical protein ACP5QG_07415 [candidate division WOR-3 bacterium]